MGVGRAANKWVNRAVFDSHVRTLFGKSLEPSLHNLVDTLCFAVNDQTTSILPRQSGGVPRVELLETLQKPVIGPVYLRFAEPQEIIASFDHDVAASAIVLVMARSKTHSLRVRNYVGSQAILVSIEAMLPCLGVLLSDPINRRFDL